MKRVQFIPGLGMTQVYDVSKYKVYIAPEPNVELMSFLRETHATGIVVKTFSTSGNVVLQVRITFTDVNGNSGVFYLDLDKKSNLKEGDSADMYNFLMGQYQFKDSNTLVKTYMETDECFDELIEAFNNQPEENEEELPALDLSKF